MCGIAGVAGMNVGEATLQSMGDAMIRRGPDDEGFFRGPDIGLAFRRLAIVDLQGGRQPMANEDGRIRIVFNGEIYEHDRLRRELQDRGHRFVTDHSDTEVLVHGWEEWGMELFPRLNGMFAVAIWDQTERQLVLARDRYGIKPLYYSTLANGACVFASEIKAILATGMVQSRPCAEGVMEYFSFQNLWQRQTMFDEINQLEPGTVLTWKDGHTKRSLFWDITFPRSRKQSLPDLAEEHRDILTRAVRRQMAADVPVKTYLSGGIDSSAISVVSRNVDPNMTAYSCIFNLDNVGDDRVSDEREYSRLVADITNMRRVEVELGPRYLQDCLDDYIESLEEPRMGMGYPVYFMAQRVAQDAKVVLSGTGGDEFHAGYVGRYQVLGISSVSNQPLWQRMYGCTKNYLRRWLRPASVPKNTDPGEIYRNVLNCFIQPCQWNEVFTPEFLREANGFDVRSVMTSFIDRCPSKDWRDRVLYVDAKTYLAGLLAFEDKVSMAHSLETRVPLLDNELVDFVLDVPFDSLWQGSVGKVLFRESVRPLVPEEVYNKPKMGFGPPDASWYRGPLRSWIEERLAPHLRDERGVFLPGYVRGVLDEHFNGRSNKYHLIWSLLSFESWCRVFGHYGAVAACTAKVA